MPTEAPTDQPGTRHSAMVYGTCRRVLGDSVESEDVAQECFIALTEERRIEERAGASLGGWLHT
ncbi:sigma factor, partial [Candidatus Hydrogenedentota bacterium]